MDLVQLLNQLLQIYAATYASAGRTMPEYAEDHQFFALDTVDDVSTLRIQGPMDGWHSDVRAMIREMDNSNPTNLHLIIESPGGYVSDGFALYSDLRARVDAGMTLTAEARGIVASAAMLPYLAADERRMGDASLLMIHNIWGGFFAIGDADEIESDLEKQLNLMRKLSDTYATVVAKRTSTTKAKITAAMKKETWYDADEAITAKLAHKLSEAAPDDSQANMNLISDARRALLHTRIGAQRNLAVNQVRN